MEKIKIEDWEEEFDKTWKQTLLICFGYKNLDSGIERKIIAEQAYSKLKYSIKELLEINTKEVKKRIKYEFANKFENWEDIELDKIIEVINNLN